MNVDLLWLAVALGCATTTLSALAAFRPRVAADPLLRDALDDLRVDLGTLRNALADDLRRSREEGGMQARDLRGEVQDALARLADGLGATVGRLGTAQAEKADAVAGTVRTLGEANERRLAEMRREAEEGAKALRGEVLAQLKALGDGLRQNLDAGGAGQKERLDGVATAIHRLVQSNAEANLSLRKTLEERLDVLRTNNEAKLEEMRRTVDEKLQGTLEKRLGESFKIVSERLETVHRGLGEMQSLATGVGDLKRVLTNVKSRGTWAEVSLGSLLDQVLTAEQFDRNVKVVPGSEAIVEYAVRLPGKGDGETVWLPIDAKFPIEDYERLLVASETGDAAAVEAALRGLERQVRLEGSRICQKYVSPPATTDFGILYLPTEGLYAEVLRRPGLVDHLQAQCRIMVAGPTNLHAFLTSLRMGFRTLAIEKRSSEVWQTLGAVKTEFAKYGEVMEAVKKKLNEASNQIDKVAVRSRAIDRKLREVESLPEAEASGRLALESLIREGDEFLDAAE